MSAAHTPGPWWIAGKATVRFGDKATSGWIADVHWRNRTANASLIAAAPELHRSAIALEGLCAWLLHRFGPDTPEGREALFRLELARAAIAKATGAVQ